MKNLTFIISFFAILSVSTLYPMQCSTKKHAETNKQTTSLSILVTVAAEEFAANKENENVSRCTLCNKTPEQGCKRNQHHSPF